MKVFYDAEFLEDGQTIELISIGLVAETGEEYYAVNSGIQTDSGLHRRISAHDWLARNVIMHLPLLNDRLMDNQLRSAQAAAENDDLLPYFSKDNPLKWDLDLEDRDVKPHQRIAREVANWTKTVADGQDIELWANYGAYDHVVLMQLWGPMIKRPEHLPMFTHDLQHFAHDLGVPWTDFPEQIAAEHDALADARHDREIWKHLERVRIRQLMAAD